MHRQGTRSRPGSWHLLTRAPQEAMRLWKRNTQHRAQGWAEQSLTANCFASGGTIRRSLTSTSIWGGSAQTAQVKEVENHHEVINRRSSVTYGGETLVQEQKVWEFEGSREENKGKGSNRCRLNFHFGSFMHVLAILLCYEFKWCKLQSCCLAVSLLVNCSVNYPTSNCLTRK